MDLMDADFESLSVAESLVALSTSALKISCPTDIPSKTSAVKSLYPGDESLGQDCSPTSVSDLWRYPRMRALSIASTVSENSDMLDIDGTFSFESATRKSLTAAASKFIGAYSPDARRKRIERFLEKRKRRVWSKKVDYDVRKNFADSRLRVKGRFVRKEDEALLCELLSYT